MKKLRERLRAMDEPVELPEINDPLATRGDVLNSAEEIINSVENIEEIEQQEGGEWLKLHDQMNQMTATVANLSETLTTALSAMTAAQIAAAENYQSLQNRITEIAANWETHLPESAPANQPANPAEVAENPVAAIVEEAEQAAEVVEAKTKKRWI